MQGYSTMSEHMLKSSKSNSELKHQGLPALPGPGGGGGGGGVGGSRGPMFDGNVSKGGPWSTLTLGPTRQVYQKGSGHTGSHPAEVQICPAGSGLPLPPGAWEGELHE